MNRAARVATSEVRRHPRPAGRFGLYVGRHPKKILNAIQLARRAMKLTGALQEALTDPRAKLKQHRRWRASQPPPDLYGKQGWRTLSRTSTLGASYAEPPHTHRER